MKRGETATAEEIAKQPSLDVTNKTNRKKQEELCRKKHPYCCHMIATVIPKEAEHAQYCNIEEKRLNLIGILYNQSLSSFEVH